MSAIREVQISHISKSGYPIATGRFQGDVIHVYGARPQDLVKVELVYQGGFYVGNIISPTPEQKFNRRKDIELAVVRGAIAEEQVCPDGTVQEPKPKPKRRKSTIHEIASRVGKLPTEKQTDDGKRYAGYSMENVRNHQRDIARRYD